MSASMDKFSLEATAHLDFRPMKWWKKDRKGGFLQGGEMSIDRI